MPPFLVISEADIADAADVDVAVFLGEAKLARQMLAAPHRRPASVTGRPPISISLTIIALAMVDLPGPPNRPVKNTVKPPACCARGRGAAQLLHHLGKGEPLRDLDPLAQTGAAARCRKMSSTVSPSGTSLAG